MRPMWLPRLLTLCLCLCVLGNDCIEGAGRLDTACRSNADCEPTEFCETGFCEDAFGQCAERPTSCDPDVDQVCGCDGRTYENECFAELNGVRLAQTGPCLCNDNSDCPSDQYCAASDSCFELGTCQPRPTACEPDPQSVCGCDGETYGNACLAAEAGVRVSGLGVCDCETNAECSAVEYCDAITCDGPGECILRTDCDPTSGVVTGCDGVVYGNDCAAAAAGVRVRPE